MKFNIILDIDDEDVALLDPRLIANVSYLQKREGTLECKTKEGVMVPYSEVSVDDFDISSVTVNKDDVVMFRFDDNATSCEDIQTVKEVLQAEFPENKVLGLTRNIDTLILNRDEAINMLEKMIAHIKISVSPSIIV